MKPEDKTSGANGSYSPKFFVTQAEYDAASPEERKRFNYAVEEEATLELPKNFNMPQNLDNNE